VLEVDAPSSLDLQVSHGVSFMLGTAATVGVGR